MAKFLNPTVNTNDADTLNASDGLITIFEHNGEMRVTGEKVKKGSSGTAYYVSASDWGDGTTVPKHFRTASYTYPTQTTTRGSGLQATYAYTFWDGGKQAVKRRTETLPAVGTGQNGPNVSAVLEYCYDRLGRMRWTKDPLGYVNYYSYHPDTGKLAYEAVDVDPTSMPGSATGNDTKWVGADEDGDGNSTYESSGIPTRTGPITTELELVSTAEFDDLGRTRKRTDAGGAEHYLVYEANRTLRFPYWDSVGSVSRMPIQVTVLCNCGQENENYSVRANYSAISTNSGAPTGFSSNPSQSDYVSWTRYNYDPLTNKLSMVDRYHTIPSSTTGTLSTNFDRTVMRYDAEGRRTHVIQTVSGTSTSSGVEQVTQMIYDVLGRVIETKRGVSNAAHDMGSGYATLPTLRTISKTAYDGGGVGNNYVTKSINYYGTGANDYTGVNYHRTYRGHNRGLEPFYHNGGSETAAGPYTILDVDWRGNAVADGKFTSNPTWGTVLTGDGYTAYAAGTTTNRRALTEMFFDDLERVYQEKTYPVSGAGATGSALLTDVYYDLNSQVVAVGSGHAMNSELAYDAAGRQYQTRSVLQLETTPYTSGAFNYRSPLPDPVRTAMSGGDDRVVQLRHQVLDATGNVTEQHVYDMNHNDTGGSGGIDLSANDDYVRATTYHWYDAAHRKIATGQYGSGDTAMGAGQWKYAAVPTRPGSAPGSSSNTVLVTKYEYDAQRGVQNIVTDPAGRKTKSFYDAFDRTIWAAENFDNFDPTNLSTISDGGDASKDRVTKTEYLGLSQTSKLIAYNGSSADAQETLYLYEDLVNGFLLTNTIYPDSSDTTSAGSDQVKVAYGVDGLPTQRTDQRGTIITYSYDNLRRGKSQKVTNLGGATDGFIRSITRGYDALGRVTKITSHGNQTDDPNNTSDIKNQIVLTYGNLGHVTRSEQSHAGAVTGSTPEVNYLYDSSNSGGVLIDGYRPNTMTYPDGRVLFYDYGANNSLEDRLLTPKRLREATSSGTILAEYSNTGLGNTVITDYQVPDVKLDLFGGTTSTYAGLDRFGRTVDHRWSSYASGTVDVARFLHGYDENSNRLYRDDPVAAAATVHLDELYAFDGLDRITSIDRGNLTTGNTVIASKVFGQDYGLDQLNNWPAFNEDTDGNGTDDITQTRDHNDANEIADIDSASTYVAHDAAGNMTKVPQPGVWNAAYDLTWDAWNRLVKVADGGNTVVAYEYDGEHRRIEKTLYKGGEPADTVHYYLSQQNQVLETRLNADSTANRQFTWGPRYVDDLVLRTRDFGKEGVESLYALQDAGWNIVALADASGTIQERFKYDPYGRSTVLDPSFANDSDGVSDFDWEYRFTSREFDGETKLSYFRARYWHDGLGRFIGRDPLEYIDGGSLYAGYFVPGSVDPDGLHTPEDCDRWYEGKIRSADEALGFCLVEANGHWLKEMACKAIFNARLADAKAEYAVCMATTKEGLACIAIGAAVGIAILEPTPIGEGILIIAGASAGR